MSRSEEENLNCMIHLISLLRRNPILMAHVKSTTIAMSNSEIESQIKLTQFFYIPSSFCREKNPVFFSQIEICPSIVLNLKLFFYRTASIISSIFFSPPPILADVYFGFNQKEKNFRYILGKSKDAIQRKHLRASVCVCVFNITV